MFNYSKNTKTETSNSENSGNSENSENSGNSENSENSEEDMFSIKNIIKYIFSDFIFLIIGLIVIIIIQFYGFKKQRLYMSIIVILLTYILLLIQHSPKPKSTYMLGLLYEETPIKTDFEHQNSSSWPFVASAVINIENKNHIFIGGGDNQKDVLLLFNTKTNKYDNVISKTILSNNSNSYSAVAFDMNQDNNEDLIVGRKDGVYLYLNQGNYKFIKEKIVDKLDKVPLAISVSDYNKDGKPDIYTSYFTPIKKYKGSVFNNPSHGRKNILLKQGKNNKYSDITLKVNAGGKQYNTFTSAFIDLNQDGWPDLVLSHDSGEVEILKNNKGKFESIIPHKAKGNWMGIGAGDIDNDGDIDLFLTNIGTDTKKNKMSLGDIKKGQKQDFKHILLQNDGNFKFTEISKEKGINGEGFGWGALLHDWDNDSNMDLIFSENTFLYPKHYLFPNPGQLFLGGSKKLKRNFKYPNRNFGQTPLITDVNRDNKKDLIWINMSGPSLTYLNNNNNNYIIISLPMKAEFLNCRIVVDTGKKKFYRENIQGGTGFGGDTNDNNIQVGLGSISKIKEIRVYTITGKKYIVKSPKINSVIKLV